MTTSPVPATSRPFADSVVAYAQAGWSCILPVPPAAKYPPPIGYTGADGLDTDPITLATWAAGEHASSSVALRMPEGIIGIDVDQYVKGESVKKGAETLAAHEVLWGPLPLTWTSTSRGPGQPSRIHFFRVPPGRYAANLEGGDVEIIQRHHRYAVVWPSVHHEVGAQYAWYDPNGSPSTPANRVPRPDELAELPPAWVQGLAAGATAQSLAAADSASGHVMLEQLRDDTRVECAEVTSARLMAVDLATRAEAGSRHDTMTARVHHLVQLGAQGHPGVGHALLELSILWDNLTAGEHRSGEFEAMLLTSARKAVTLVGAHQVVRDPCLDLIIAPPSAAASDPGAELDPAPADDRERLASMLNAIGVHAFDPVAQLDQPLAENVLERMYPSLRFAYDSRGWILRVPDRWELHGRLSPWAVAQVAKLMPVGDPTAEKGSEQHARSARRARLMSTAGARAIAGKMDDLVGGGMHPATVALAQLDADPDVLWAGGMPYSLRTSAEGPTLALVDPATPHLHTAGFTPMAQPTPLWDAFLEAVWPDPEIRAWALRVLSIAFTGYADRALPILLGETGRGKTQVIALLMSVLGTYGHAANPKLLSSGSKEHDTIVFDLKGRRLSFIDEAPSEAKAGQERLKQLTGGGELTARPMNQDPTTFRPTHTLVLTANDEPVLTDPAIRSRVRLIPCEGDPELVRLARAAIGHVKGRAWRAEAPGVLAAMMAQAAGWLAEPHTALTAAAPESIRYLAEHFGAEQDPVSVWLAEECEPWEDGTPSRELYQAFVASCRRNSMRTDAIPTETKWGRALTRLGYPSTHGRGGKVRQLRVKPLGGWTGGMVVPQAPNQAVTGWTPPTGHADGQKQTSPGPVPPSRDGLPPSGDGLVTGSDGNPSQANAQVNLPFSVPGDGLTGSPSIETPHARDTRAQGEPVPTSPEPVTAASEPAPKKTRKPVDPEKAEAARVKRAAATEEKRLAAIAEAAGEHLEMPAVLTRDGQLAVIDLAAGDQLLETITSEHALTVDVEHTGYPVGHRLHRLKSVQLGNEHFCVILDPFDEDQRAVIRRHLERAPALHAHSATADLVPLAHAGLLDAGLDHAWARMLDTGVAAKLADPAAKAGLKELAPTVLGQYAVSPDAEAGRAALFKAGKWLTDTEPDTPIERSGWAQVDPCCGTMLRYAGSDVLDTAAIAARATWPEGDQLAREKLAQRMTARIADKGIRIDGEHVDELLAQQHAELAKWGEVLIGFGAENPGSDQQVAAVAERLGAALPRTATGKPSVAAGVLEPMRELEGDLGDFVRARLAYQKAKTRRGLILEPYHQLVVNGDGRARPTVYTLGARTGRMSCALPNLQQVPREGGFRACLTADPGHVLISADFASVEIRVAAALSQDTALIAMLEQGVDLHWEAARQVYGPDATKSNRYDVKRGVFGWLYGGQAPTLAKQMAVSEPTAQLLIDTLANLLPGVTYWREMTREGVKAGRTQFPTYAGRIVHMPVQAPHAAPNYCIQGSARELLIDGLIRWSETRWGDAVLLPVHDEIVSMVPEDEAEEATASLVQAMAGELYGLEIKVEASAPAFAWADAA